MSEDKIVTYSPAYTIVPTYECFNRCSYCNFRVDPGKSPWLSVAAAASKLKSLQGSGVWEILILSGEVHPLSKRRQAWLDLIYDICKVALELGFLPHTNVGPLSFAEMSKLKQVNVSMGLMLEELTPKLLATVHQHAPSKVPEWRHQQLKWAGELKIPFTTGLLLGIGETETDREETLQAIAQLQQTWGNIQEVILQPYSPGTKESLQNLGFNLSKLPEVVATARQILPSSIKIQIPPNLVRKPSLLLECLVAGARDLGGISPIDEVNPDYPHIQHKSLREILSPAGWELVPRLPVYPQYYKWLDGKLQAVVSRNHR
ncbi:7,8-didemethyl-8-hydroxy-5-deazariboflavin synthase subunit CofG [Oscillatoria salina]|uniref:7,8-didemethyl-8-hydroxy-5-deazariboflavin synthase subunit CofG n=1 Tax=Oscillatoria salina TaxID=331517 RepID=UPI0013B6E9EF|nr:7,8-didemethyl-8-hydroxy-5-deazariboflavin synthase subunit CofG [Oscillatoria salina]MBZ8182051.1 7,8-didemethyl-8-hydroxy-5-deazariboflavin synthase subunit CofG [Oscillatoria salina IIICB1]NET89800.1 7,8-didemethyl-8-hydroxy-5-deazariboflavin synthase subunit CofG [Kamptonema sp. SIO1D9]